MPDDENDPIEEARVVKHPVDILPSHGYLIWREIKVSGSVILVGSEAEASVRCIVIAAHPRYIMDGIELKCDYKPGDELMTFGPIPAQRHNEQESDHRVSLISAFAGKVVRRVGKGLVN